MRVSAERRKRRSSFGCAREALVQVRRQYPRQRLRSPVRYLFWQGDALRFGAAQNVIVLRAYRSRRRFTEYALPPPATERRYWKRVKYTCNLHDQQVPEREGDMSERNPLFDPKAGKQTVSITLNSDLYAKAKSVGINTSRVAEEALAVEYAERRRDALHAEVQQDLAATDSYAEQNRSFADFVREHYERDDDAV